MNETATAIELTGRGVISVAGPDAGDFLQGLITNDICRAGEGHALYAALLTPQGKYLHDFFIIKTAAGFLLDCERGRRADLLRRLMMYRLRAKVEIVDQSDAFAVWALLGEGGADGIVFNDPRHPDLGRRSIMATGQQPELPLAPFEHYENLRLTLGIPDGSRDIEVEKTFILEASLDALSGVDFLKGCYVGQEMTARMKHRGIIKKRLLPVIIDGPLPESGTDILDKDGKAVGDVRSGLGNRAIAYLRLEGLDERSPLTSGGHMVTPEIPDWLQAVLAA